MQWQIKISSVYCILYEKWETVASLPLYPRQGHLPQRFHSLKFEFHSDACHKLAEVLHEHVFQFTRERN